MVKNSKTTTTTLPANVTVAAAGVCTRNLTTQVSAARVAQGVALLAANGNLGAKGATLLQAAAKVPACKPNSVWGIVYAVAKGLGAAGNGTFTMQALQAALVAYQWQATGGIATKHTLGQLAPTGSPQYAAYVKWVATLSTQAHKPRFGCTAIVTNG